VQSFSVRYWPFGQNLGVQSMGGSGSQGRNGLRHDSFPITQPKALHDDDWAWMEWNEPNRSLMFGKAEGISGFERRGKSEALGCCKVWKLRKIITIRMYME
jgi:hypothetical protein